jgi:hypothetical protein
MPAPLVVAAIPWILGALAGGALTAWATGSDDEWKDKDVFNSRMRDLQLGILQLNTLLAQQTKLDAPTRKMWADYVKLWSAYYRDIGTLTFFGPSASEISESKRFADLLSKWIAYYAKTFGPLPTGMMPASTPTSNYVPIGAPGQKTEWGKIALYAVGIFTGGLVLSSFIKSKF